jgi:hypothetical protein
LARARVTLPTRFVERIRLIDAGVDERHHPRLGGVLLTRRRGTAMEELVGRIKALDARADVLDDPSFG